MNEEKTDATWLTKEKKVLREFARKIKKLPENYQDENGHISQEKIKLALIEYHRLHL